MPSVSIVNGAEPLTASVAAACAVTVPAVCEVNVIVHCPLASVFALPCVQVPVGAVCAAPFESVSVTVTCSPPRPRTCRCPVSFCSVTVNVCGWPTSFVAFGAIEILALTKVLTASPLFSSSWSVCTVNGAEPSTAASRSRAR